MEQRFWDKVDRKSADECWEWQAGAHVGEYGQFWLHGRMRLAHRIAWELEHGPIPDGMCILHACDNPNCVNPNHLRLGTVADNNEDRERKGRGRYPILRGEKNGCSKLTRVQVHTIRHLYNTGDYTYRELGERFGIDYSLIGHIIHKRRWGWL